MDLLEQCQKWCEHEEHEKIIEVLEAIPEEERTPEMDSELARAYNNMADFEDRELYKKALRLLLPHEEYFQGDHRWNFRVGYAYFYLNQEGRALPYFKAALEARPGDGDTEELIEACRARISLPRFRESFRERTWNAWQEFAAKEADIRRLLDEDKEHERGEEVIEKCGRILETAFDDIAFEMGFNGEKHELILTPEGDKVNLFELVYFADRAPQKVLERWNILVGRQPMPNVGLRAGRYEISGEDVQVQAEKLEESSVGLKLYCAKLAPLLEKDEDRAWWMVSNLTDQVLGEISAMRYIDRFDLSKEPLEGESCSLTRLPEALENMGLELSVDPQKCLDSYIGYSTEPDKDPEADWRLDVIAGSTNCVPLLNDYLHGESHYVDSLHADGAAAGFFCYPIHTLKEENSSDRIFAFRDQLEACLEKECGADLLTLTGGATGLYCGYVDFIAWDLRPVLNAAQKFFKESGLPWANFHSFRRDAVTIPLVSEEEEGLPEDFIPYDPQNPEPFYDKIEEWNDDDRYSVCIRALDTIHEQDWNYRTAYALARALENYAILGDGQDGCAEDERAACLERALSVLENVREEGQDKAEWNMRMAYAYQYLEEYAQAIPYAERWQELDPEDEDAAAVIEECLENIKERGADDAENETAAGDEEPAAEDGGEDAKGTFTGFVLLSKAKWDKKQLISDLKEKWDIDAREDEGDPDYALVFECGDMLAAVSLMNGRIPKGEAEANAENNYMWPEAVQAAKAHKAHIMVAVISKGEDDLLERGKLYTKIMAACCRQQYALGVYTSGVVFEPRFYEGFADMMRDGDLPVFNWIWFGLYRSEKGVSGYTYGMDVFGRDEIEVLDTAADPSDLRDFMAGIVTYVLHEDAALQDGETIGFSEEDKHKITRSEGVALPGMTLKISYEADAAGAEDDEEDDDAEENAIYEYEDSGEEMDMDDAAWHIESIEEKGLQVDEIAAYNHMAIYLRWCMENKLMGRHFMERYGQLAEQVKADPASAELREFIRDELDGVLFTGMFNEQGAAFARYYYGSNDYPYYPSDIDCYAVKYIGEERNYSDEIQDEAYLFVPYDEKYYRDMAELISRRFENWKGQKFGKKDREPSALAEAMMKYLDCECVYFPPMADDDPIMSAYAYARRDAAHEGYIPMLVNVDEILWECLMLNSDPESEDAGDYAFNPQAVAEYRQRILAAPVRDGAAVLAELVGKRREEAEEDELDWDELFGKMEGGYSDCRFFAYWNRSNKMTCPLILAKIPVKNPWEVFAYLPFGDWNECPGTEDLMAAAKYWFEKYSAVPAAMTHDELQFDLPQPVPAQEAMKLAEEQYGFCPDMDQNFEELGMLADTLRQSDKWYFWWD